MTSIERNAFSGCTSLKLVKLPNGLKRIGYGAFMDTAIESITLPETLETIENHAFKGCQLKTFTIPKCVLKLPWESLPSSLVKLVIPEDFKKFEDYCCPEALKIVYCHAKSPQFAFSFFLNGLCHYNDLEIHVPQGCKSAYENSDWNRDRITIIDDL